jgi:hypothetical protein
MYYILQQQNDVYITIQIQPMQIGHKQEWVLKNQRLSRACIVHLVIKKTNWSYVKTMSCVILELRST